MPKPHGQSETHYLGLVVKLPDMNPLACIPVENTPDADDLADLLAAAMQRPMTDQAHRPKHFFFRGNPRWQELFPRLKKLGIDVSIHDMLPAVENV